ncbi:betaine-aldehyde dehydrogenase (plasmid) [Halostagnicola larsenii XH-48]|uniref:Betaine-aldehyde dehydrogenase n=1 Tax=Halostagnicola larsenii XH-48 TaxID=797299 RepID=W0JYJ4_9EURY|nr:aldehyde dehydrogenase family protein [Halostagnicola larsenii]AHG02078.1 betaine-aldehyde dehydrogenase [Halostagnicola larsenii XH-48]
MASSSDSDSQSKETILSRHRTAAEEVVSDHTQLYIGGEWQDAASGETFDTLDPTTGEVLASVPRGRAEDVDRAIEAAWDTYEREWSETTTSERQAVLLEIADRVEAHSEELAKLETLDNGKTLMEARIDMNTTAEQFRYFAGVVESDRGQTEDGDGYHGKVIHEPYGVVGQIIPWNFPLAMASWKLAPALAAGNCSVIKPAEQTPLSLLRLMELVDDVVPDGVVNVVTGYGEEAGAPLSKHEGVRKIAFTGSTVVGKQIMRNAADNVTDVTLELGGKSPIVVHEDADPQAAVETIAFAIFANTGECCEAGSRLFVHEDVADDVLEGLIGAAEGMTVGDPLDEATDLGPKVSHEQVERTTNYLESAREGGAEFLAGGEPPEDEALEDGCFVAPTLVEGLDHEHEAVQEEIFGPVLEVFRWEDYDEMMTLANDVDYGLAGGVITNDIEKADRTAHDIEAGYIWVNTWHEMSPGLPYGGYKQSGIGRELSVDTLDHYTQTKSIKYGLH